ncbi:MAG TPA: HDIG domain-containing protein [Candidatus Thermoplasmatota archaeon]|nr:HDIG domain-containing protein [Candidatus Thermoplasmatota archaeon]
MTGASVSGPDGLRSKAWARLVAAEPPKWVLGHCRSVEALADAMCDCAEDAGLAVDRDVVRQGALLHDVGRSVTQDVRHATVGAEMLRKDGWDEAVVLVVERHTGAGIDAAEAKALGLPVRDYTPRTLEERIVAHADNLHSGETRLGLAELEAKYRAKKLPRAWQKIQALHDELEDLLMVDLEELAPARLTPP